MNRERIPYMMENTPEEFQRVRDLASSSPVPVAAKGTDELREALVEVLRLYGILGERLGSVRPGSIADALLDGPLAPLLAKLQAVETLANELESGRTVGLIRQDVADRLRRALGCDRG